MSDTQQRSKGREVPLEDFTFEGTGITVKIRRVSPLLRDDIDAQLRIEFPQPEVPVVRRNYGTEEKPEWIEEPDPMNAKYKEELRVWGIQHANRVGDKLLWVAVRRGVDLELTEEMKREVDEIREDLRLVGVELDPSDKFVYITRIALGSTESLRELYDMIFSRSRPTREEVEAMKATFPGNVQEERHLQVQTPGREDQVVRKLQLDGSLEVLRDPVAGV